MVNTMARKIALSAERRYSLFRKFENTLGIGHNNIPIEFDKVFVLRASMGAMAGVTRSAATHPILALDMEGMKLETLVT